MSNHKSIREIIKEAKDYVQKAKAGETKGMYCISYENPYTVIYCRTKEKRKIHEKELTLKKIPYKLFKS